MLFLRSCEQKNNPSETLKSCFNCKGDSLSDSPVQGPKMVIDILKIPVGMSSSSSLNLHSINATPDLGCSLVCTNGTEVSLDA